MMSRIMLRTYMISSAYTALGSDTLYCFYVIYSNTFIFILFVCALIALLAPHHYTALRYTTPYHYSATHHTTLNHTALHLTTPHNTTQV